MLKRKIIVGIAACSIMLAGCVSEQSYVGSEKPVANRSFDNIEAARTRISLGLNYLRRGDSSQAKYNLERARSFAPNSAEVYSALAYYYENVGEPDQAEEYYLTAIDKDANYADAYNNYGAFLCQLQKYEASERLLLQAISRPGYIRVAESYENLALCQLQQNNFRKTKTYLISSINHNSTRISSLVLASGLSYAMGEMTEAKNQLARIQRLGRVSARTVLLSYLIADKSGDSSTKNNAEQLLLTLYMGSAETTLLLQNKLAASEFELLRERYKETLMSNITLPTDTTNTAISQPVINPKLKVVKRKTTTPTVITEPVAASVAAVAATTTSSATTVPVLKNATSDIANSLVISANKTQVLTTTKPRPLPAETILKNNQSIAANDPVPVVEPVSGAENNVTVISSEQLAQLTAEQELESGKTLISLTEPTLVDAPSENVTAKQVETTESEPAQAVIVAIPPPLTEAASDHKTQVVVHTDDDVDIDVDVSTEKAESNFHLVQESDSLYAISMKYNIRLQRLMEWNQLTPESSIQTGQKVWLQQVSEQQRAASFENAAKKNTNPQIESRIQVTTTEPYHQVAAGETMFAISYRYNIKLDKFMAWNALTEQSKLQVGQQLLVVDPALLKP